MLWLCTILWDFNYKFKFQTARCFYGNWRLSCIVFSMYVVKSLWKIFWFVDNIPRTRSPPSRSLPPSLLHRQVSKLESVGKLFLSFQKRTELQSVLLHVFLCCWHFAFTHTPLIIFRRIRSEKKTIPAAISWWKKKRTVLTFRKGQCSTFGKPPSFKGIRASRWLASSVVSRALSEEQEQKLVVVDAYPRACCSLEPKRRAHQSVN